MCQSPSNEQQLLVILGDNREIKINCKKGKRQKAESVSAAMHVINCCSKTNKRVICLFVCIYRYNLLLANGLAIVQGTEILNPIPYGPPPNFVVSSSITIKFGVLIEFDKFSPK